MREETYNQLRGLILLSCIDQCNKLLIPREEYETRLNHMLFERGFYDHISADFLEEITKDA